MNGVGESWTSQQRHTTSGHGCDVAFLALGSIGDCLPLCALASAGEPTAALVTHRKHCEMLEDLLHNAYTYTSDEVAKPRPRLCPVEIPILFGGSGTMNVHDDKNDASSAAQRGPKRVRRHEGADDAEGTRAPQDEEGDDEENDAVCREMDACVRVLEDLAPKVLVFNLFSVFGYHLADALGIPCLCASPGVPPSGGGVPLRRILPRAFLERIDRIDERVGDPSAARAGDKVTRADLEVWMLPLFHPRYRGWRRSRDLPPDLSSSTILPRAPPIIFGVSPTLLPRPGFWPAKADVCGFWSFPRLSPQYRPPERLARFLSRCEALRKPVFAVGLGSMPELGLVQNPGRILKMVVSCLRRAGVAAVMLPTGDMAATTGHGDSGSGLDEIETGRLELTGEAFVPHSWLLPRCRGIVHHGGSGTTGAAMSAGVVQMVIPMAFDQFFFAGQVEYIGVGARIDGTFERTFRNSSERAWVANGDGISMTGIEKALRLVLTEGVRAAAARYRELVRDEAGVEIACAKIAAVLDSSNSVD